MKLKLRWILESQQFQPRDELTRLVEDCAQEEFGEEELELVTAAEIADYQRFVDLITKNIDRK